MLARRAWVPLALLLLILALFGWRAGWRAADLDPSAAIAAVAKAHERDFGAPALCEARPAERPVQDVWLMVSCEGAGMRVNYQVDRVGRIIARTEERKPEA